jgi:hypothetical protein
MKKLFIWGIIFFLLINSAPIIKGNFSVTPREISVIIDVGFQILNKNNFITVKNTNNYSINISYYLDNPDPISWIRPNRTLIPYLSWIYIKPLYQVIPPEGSGKFYINHDIPKSNENLNKKWEVWIVFKQQEIGFLNFENVVRLLIDTPIKFENIDEKEKDILSISTENKESIPFSNFLIIGLIITLALIALFIFNKKKKSY